MTALPESADIPLSAGTVVCRACQHPRDGERRMTAAITTLDALRNGSKKGCVTCYIFSLATEKLGRKERPGVEDDWNSHVRFDFQMSYLGDHLSLYVISLGLRISFFCLEETPWLQNTLPDLPLGRPTPTSTASEATVEWAKYQLQQCSSSHVPCKSRKPSPLWTPRRLLDIHNFEQNQIHLIETPQNVETYACLSYCWGRKPFLQTTSHNFQSHARGIAMKELPVAFVDAIYYARRLEIFYLWIDSLCIIQDDADDWKQESAQMASIYQNAHVVLSVTKLFNPHAHIFGDLDPKFEAHKVEIQTSETHEEVWFRRSLDHMPSVLHDSQPQSPLPTLSRGWIFQERLLAARVLHFGPHELLWECLQHSACQCTAEPAMSSSNTAAPALSNISLGGRELQLKSAFNLHNWKSWDEAVLCRCWHKLVEQYSKLNLTHDSDIFPAFSGVSKQFQAALESKSLAGLWEKTLLKDLLWHSASFVDGLERPWVRPVAWRAPTWSWASIRYPATFIDTSQGIDPCCTVKEACCTAAGIDPTGEVADAHLILEGNFVPTLLNYSSVDIDSEKPQQSTSPSSLYLFGEVGSRIHNVWADTDTSIEGKDYVAAGTEVYILPIGIRTISKAIESLILKLVSCDEKSGIATYERIGLLELPRAPLDGLDEWIRPSQRKDTIKLI